MHILRMYMTINYSLETYIANEKWIKLPGGIFVVRHMYHNNDIIYLKMRSLWIKIRCMYKEYSTQEFNNRNTYDLIPKAIEYFYMKHTVGYVTCSILNLWPWNPHWNLLISKNQGYTVISTEMFFARFQRRCSTCLTCCMLKTLTLNTVV